MANNPLAKANSIGFQNYYTPSLYGLEGMSANTFMIRPVLVTPRLVIRATIPVVTTPAMKADPISGLVSGKAIISMGLEPQFTFLHHGAGQPQFQIFAGLNIQFPAKSKTGKK